MTKITVAPQTPVINLEGTSRRTRWLVCGLLFAATTINYMDRSVLSLIEPLLHSLAFMGWNPAVDAAHQTLFNTNYKHIVQCFQVAYGIGLLIAGRVIDRVGTKAGYMLAIGVWALSSMGHAAVYSVAGFCIARFLLGLGESGNFPAAIKATTEWFPTEERALATGLFNSGANVSFFIAPVLVASVTARFGWQAAFLATGSLGLLWLIAWAAFPYDQMLHAGTRSKTPTPAASLTAETSKMPPLAQLLAGPRLYAFALAKGLTDPIWWFYLFYLPKFLHETYNLDLAHAKWQIVTVYMVSSVGSIFGGAVSGQLIRRGYPVNAARKLAMLFCAVLVLPVAAVPYLGALFHTNAWPATFAIALAAAAHQGWSANLFSTATDMFPSTAVSSVVGIGGAIGSLGGVIFTGVVGSYFSLHPLPIFVFAASSYLLSLAFFHLLVPNLSAFKMHGLAAN